MKKTQLVVLGFLLSFLWGCVIERVVERPPQPQYQQTPMTPAPASAPAPAPVPPSMASPPPSSLTPPPSSAVASPSSSPAAFSSTTPSRPLPRLLVYAIGDETDWAAATVEEVLQNEGARLVDRSQLSNIREIDAALAGDTQKRLALKYRYGCEYVVRLRVRYQNRRFFVKFTAISVDTGEIVFVKLFRNPFAYSLNRMVPLLRRGAQMCAQALRAYEARKSQSHEFEVVVSGVNHEFLMRLEQYLRQSGRITSIGRRSFALGTAFYTVGFRGSRGELEQLLLSIPGLGLTVVRTTTNRIELAVPLEKRVQNLFGDVKEQKVVFVLDASGSMVQTKTPLGTRLAIAKKELIQTLRKLPPTTFFGVLAFGDQVNAWQKGLVAATPQNVASAVQWVQSIGYLGGTATYDALEFALTQFPGVQAIYFLSDGEPSRGKITDPAQILAALAQINRQGIRIHTIAFVLSGTKQNLQIDQKAADFMAQIARQSGGWTKVVK